MSAEEKILSGYNKDFRESNRVLREKIVALQKENKRLKKKLEKLTGKFS